MLLSQIGSYDYRRVRTTTGVFGRVCIILNRIVGVRSTTSVFLVEYVIVPNRIVGQKAC